ncbi:hypothetical protein CCM_07300 [Cordyceps militaris CM01]|uniref:Uncharacterized protein n=1 Tax=Cordyceps militaris (strain CM01) TaxID=983644 RepID=G3JMQ4_CORMM|nr:uncharacterized protein CCM_07300 [Cordyceps militaris CM01]EGX90880.1 hypothetical protein CCM_07300 [Cordyceps militaris CM01]
MCGPQAPQAPKTLPIDVEGQQERRRSSKATLEQDNSPRIVALQALFGFTHQEMCQVRGLPTIASWCRYLEGCFQPLLTEQYESVWLAFGLPRPKSPSHCWPLFEAVCRAVVEVDEEGYSIQDVWRLAKISIGSDSEAVAEEDGLITPAAHDECMIVVFAIICWGSMILQPQVTRRQSANPCLSVHQLSARHQGLKMDFVRRPIPVIFRNFRKTLTSRQLQRTSVTGEPCILFVSTINYHSLRTIGKVRLKWVDNLSSHLNFDSRTRTLSVFQFPSFCALSTIPSDRGILFEELVRTLFSTGDEIVRELESSRQLGSEVLMSYRLLFGQTRAARKLGKTELQTIKDSYDYDQLLDCLCTNPRKEVVKKLPDSFWPASCRGLDNTLQEDDSYSSQDDFPMLGSRLAAIQEFNLRQQPSRLRDLWRDRRNPLQWYTFWAVLVVGGLSIILAILQLTAAILAVVPLRG